MGKKIAAIKMEEGITDGPIPWAYWLPEIMFSMNCERHETLHDCPYRVVFCQSPPTPVFPHADRQVLNEEDCDELFARPGM